MTNFYQMYVLMICFSILHFYNAEEVSDSMVARACTKFPKMSVASLWLDNGHCYYFINTVDICQAAKLACMSANTHLVTFQNMGELDFVTRCEILGLRFIPSGVDFWMGLVKSQTTCDKWVWEDMQGLHPDDLFIPNLRQAPVTSTPQSPDSAAMAAEQTWKPASSLSDPRLPYVCEDDHPSEVYAPKACLRPTQLAALHSLKVTVLFDPRNMKCYYITMSPSTWDEANAACAADVGMTLAFLETVAETVWLSNELMARDNSHNLWIGLNFDLPESTWEWRTRISRTAVVLPQWNTPPLPGSLFGYLMPDIRKWGSTDSDNLPFICEDNLLARYLNVIMCGRSGLEGRAVYLTSTESCYVFASLTYTLDEATTLCSNARGTLISMLTSQDKDYLLNAMYPKEKSITGIWTSLSFYGGCFWDSDGRIESQDTYMSWAQPDQVMPDSDHIALTPDGLTQAQPTDRYKVVCTGTKGDPEMTARYVCRDQQETTLTVFRQSLRSCYYYYNTPLTFAAAQAVCHSYNSHLFVPETALEQEELRTILNTNSLSPTVWLGLKKMDNGLRTWIYQHEYTVIDGSIFSSSFASFPTHAVVGENGDLIPTPPNTPAPFMCETEMTVGTLRALLSLQIVNGVPVSTTDRSVSTPETPPSTTVPRKMSSSICSAPSLHAVPDHVNFKRVYVIHKTLTPLENTKSSSVSECAKRCANSRKCWFFFITVWKECCTLMLSAPKDTVSPDRYTCDVNMCFQRVCEEDVDMSLECEE